MKRGSATSGGKEHIELVKLATKKIVDTFVNLRFLQISYEHRELTFEIRIKEEHYGYTNTHLEYRPDIAVKAENKRKETEGIYKKPIWNSVFDSTVILFEVETNPQNFFSNTMKVASYKKIKSSEVGRGAYAFVLVCWEDAQLPDSIEPFDIVWKFKKPANMEKPE